MRKALWKKLVVGARMQRVFGRPKCEVCGGLETVSHVLSTCKYLPFAADSILKAFGPVRDDNGGVVVLQQIIMTHPELSLSTTQGLALWAVVQASRALTCDVVFRGGRGTRCLILCSTGLRCCWYGQHQMKRLYIERRIFIFAAFCLPFCKDSQCFVWGCRRLWGWLCSPR